MQKFLFLFILLFPSIARADVAVTHNIHYGQNAAQIVDVYRPDACRDTFCPVVLWVHGGGWKHGDMQGRAATQMMTAWAARGMGAISSGSGSALATGSGGPTRDAVNH